MGTDKVSKKVRSQLWGTTGNICAFPGCNMRVVEYREDLGVTDVVGDMCHIISEKPDGPRSVTKLTEDELERWSNLVDDLDGFENLLVMCKGHNKEVDGSPHAWPIEKLVIAKKKHLAIQTGPVLIRKGVLGPQFEATDLPTPVFDALQRIAKRDEVVATELDNALANGGLERFHRMLEEGDTWLEKSSWSRWEAIGTICQTSGRQDLARPCFLRAFEADGCPEPARELVYAAGAAGELGDDAECRELVERAYDIDPDSPLVALNWVAQTSDANAVLDLAPQLTPTDPRDVAAVSRMNATAYLQLGQFDAARQVLKEARTASSHQRELDKISLVIDLDEANERAVKQERQDAGALRTLSARFLVEADYARASGNRHEGHLRGHAAEALLLADEDDEAIQILEMTESLDAATSNAEAAITLSQQALRAGRPDLAATFAEPHAHNRDSLAVIAALHRAQSDDAATAAAGERELGALLDSTEDGAARNAADVLLVVTINRADARWHEKAATILKEASPEREAHLRGVFHHKRGDTKAAQQAWLSSKDNPRAIRLRLELALDNDDLDTAITLGGQLHALGGDRNHSLRYSNLLARAERYSEAIPIFYEIARDEKAPRGDRDQAYLELMRIGETILDPGILLTGGREWLQITPSSERARWSLIYGHVLSGDYPGAYAYVTDDLKPEGEGMVDLLSAVLGQALSASEAIVRLDALSVAHNREHEIVEYRIVMTGMMRGTEGVEDADGAEDITRTEGAEEAEGEAARGLTPEAEAIYIRALGEFPERFPESRLLIQFNAEGPEDLIAALQKYGRSPERQQAVAEVLRWVEEGRMPVAFLADITNRDTMKTILTLGVKPLLYGVTDVAAQAAEADQRYGVPVACDAATLGILAILPEDITQAILTSIQGSWISTSTANECVSFTISIKLGEPTMVGDIDHASGQLEISSVPPQITDRLQVARTRIDELRGNFTVEVDHLQTDPDNFAAQLLGKEKIDRSVYAMASSMLLAQRHGTALYTDDRVARQLARELGIPTFGTLGLIEVLAKRNDITTERARTVIGELLTTLANHPIPWAEDDDGAGMDQQSEPGEASNY